MFLPKAKKSELREVIEKRSGGIVEGYSSAETNVLVANTTLGSKYLKAMSQGTPIVSEDWITASVRSQSAPRELLARSIVSSRHFVSFLFRAKKAPHRFLHVPLQ
jgi:hypothetical protein